MGNKRKYRRYPEKYICFVADSSGYCALSLHRSRGIEGKIHLQYHTLVFGHWCSQERTQNTIQVRNQKMSKNSRKQLALQYLEEPQ